jgi:membrane protease YdiL (CAAX protease family)
MSISPRFILPAFFLTLFLGAMILGPVLYCTLGWIAPHAVPFHRAMDRALLVSAVAALSLAWTRLPLRKFWPWNRDTWKHLLLGYVMAAVTAQAIIGFNLAFSGFTRTLLSFGEMETRILLALIAAIVVPLLEETVFRGFLQGEFTNRFGWRVGWIGTAAIFALSHFLKISPDLDREPVYPWSGVTAVGNAFLPIIHGEFLSGRGLNLFLLGLILGGIVLRSGILWVNAGLHSGLILAVFLFNGFTRPVEPPRIAWLGGDILSNPITSVVFVLLGLWLWRFYRHPSILPETGETAP